MLAIYTKMPPAKLLKQVKQTGDKLRALLETPDLNLKLALAPNDEIKQDASKQWAANRDGFHWGTYLDELQGTTNKFIVAAYSGSTLTSLCLYRILEQNPSRFQIQAIEGKKDGNPLKGYTTPIFNQLALDIAQEFEFNELGVIWPEANTVRRHTRLINYSSEGTNLVAPVSEATEVNWAAQFKHQRVKGLYVPTHAR